MTDIIYRWHDAFETAGQRYVRIGERPYVRKKDGQQTMLAIWQSDCIDCGQPFTTDQSSKPCPAKVPRRCRRCIDANRIAKVATRIPNVSTGYTQSIPFPSPSAPFVPAYDMQGETGHPAPHTEGPAGSQDVLQGAPAANVAPAVRPSKARQTSATKRAATDKRSAFTDR